MEEVYIIDGNEYTLAEIQDFASAAGLELEDYLSKNNISKKEIKNAEQDFQKGVVDNVDATVTPKAPEASEEEKTSIWDYISEGASAGLLLNPATALPTALIKGGNIIEK